MRVALFFCFLIVIPGLCASGVGSEVVLKRCCGRRWCGREEFNTEFQPVSSVCAGSAFVMAYKRDPNVTSVFLIVGNHQIYLCLMTSPATTDSCI